MRLMAIDYGEKRVGIALTDETGSFALPRAVWPNDRSLMDKVIKLIKEEAIGKIIIGESKNLDGSANPVQKEINKFKDELQKSLLAEVSEIEIIFHPEVFTTVEARRLQGQTDMTDASAAALILKSFIDTVYNKGI
ncbi:MAG: Holliday junction resolvase RuvX [Candidatus Zambryskibacteria bacterium CG22_combo_CG10-13_8_21_14_all_42_17]|uniref:Putative pre-16S rRNA nuclease n=1 Tax=Candidatus Zambryskibacteria bacterium CG22_combo_CG10-13_8_21_14_all_42_17 TaxID=1975118 RepID=A0A2H0BDP0_9BACT|nr:MAG: Holliday junction resolvase RuvX [Candidatus Zambryskibacteria bacterium CG22_combo_CG10-13_8_21_14_all_42_17]